MQQEGDEERIGIQSMKSASAGVASSSGERMKQRKHNRQKLKSERGRRNRTSRGTRSSHSETDKHTTGDVGGNTSSMLTVTDLEIGEI